MQSLEEFKQQEIQRIKEKNEAGILETQNAEFLIKLIQKTGNAKEVLQLVALGINYKRKGFHFDVRLEKSTRNISYLKRREDLSFSQEKLTHKLIIGDNYPALLNLLISYDNAITRDNLLSMLFARLTFLRELLCEDGVIFISIDDNEQANLKLLCDEIFGEGNFIENFIWIKNATKNLSKTTSNTHEYILCYAKDKSIAEQSSFFRIKKPVFDEVQAILAKATKDKLSKEQTTKMLKDFYKANKHLKGITLYEFVEFKEGRYQAYCISDISAPLATGKAATYELLHLITKKPCKIPATGWRFTQETMEKMIKENLIEFYENESKVPRVKRFLDSVGTNVMKSYIENFTDGKKELNRIFGESPFDNPKPTTPANNDSTGGYLAA